MNTSTSSSDDAAVQKKTKPESAQDEELVEIEQDGESTSPRFFAQYLCFSSSRPLGSKITLTGSRLSLARLKVRPFVAWIHLAILESPE